MQRLGWRKLLVAGGPPGTRGELERLCERRLDIRFVTEETTPNRKTVAPLFDWSDDTAIWSSTEIPHKATAVLRGREEGLEGGETQRGGAGRSSPGAL